MVLTVGPSGHGSEDQQCHKKPKQQEHEECYVDYDIIVDVTYIEECEYVVIMKTMLVITTSVPLILVTMGTLVVLTVKTRRRSSATSTPRKTLARSPSRLARKLWTPSILKSVRRESTPIVRNHMRGVTTALVLLIIILRL